MTEKWRLARLKQEQCQLLDEHLPGLPRWKQVQQVFNGSIFAVDRHLFGPPRRKEQKQFGKRGELQNLLMMGVVAFVVALLVIFCAFIFGQVSDKWAELPVTQESKDVMSDVVGMYADYFDWAVLFVLVGSFLATLVMSFMIVLHPALSIIYFFGLVIVTFVLGVLSNAFQDIVAYPALASTAAQFPLIGTVMGWLPLIVFLFGITCGAVMFKLRSVMMA